MHSCPTCHKDFKSYKSYHRHKTLSHTSEIGATKDKIKNDYLGNPKQCTFCEVNLSFEQRRNKFCSSSCSAQYTNQRRINHGDKVRQAWRQKNGYINHDMPRIHQYPKEHNCLTCNTPFLAYHANKRFCSNTCNTSKYAKIGYRQACSFNLNKVDHPSLFNALLIETYGWYTPANKGTFNPNGVCWDHLYRIQDGFKNNVPPDIMSHPANAELVPWTVNTARRQSMITYEELCARIILWDAGEHHSLQRFYVLTSLQSKPEIVRERLQFLQL